MTRRLLASAVLLLSALPLHAQTIDDSLMVPKKSLFLARFAPAPERSALGSPVPA